MPLPTPSVPRQRAHTRSIEIEGFLRDDGLYELEASLQDVKENDFEIPSGLRPGGVPIHLMRVRLSFDHDYIIREFEACSDYVPYPGYCESIAPTYRQLIGVSVMRGFRRRVAELFADVRGCSHLSELLNSLPTAAMQTVVTFQYGTRDDSSKPFPLDRCHALDTSAGAVREYYPKWYRAPGEAD